MFRSPGAKGVRLCPARQALWDRLTNAFPRWQLRKYHGWAHLIGSVFLSGRQGELSLLCWMGWGLVPALMHESGSRVEVARIAVSFLVVMSKLLLVWFLVIAIGTFGHVVAQSPSSGDDPLLGRSVVAKITGPISGTEGGYEIQWDIAPGGIYEVETAVRIGGDWTTVEKREGVEGESVATYPIEISAAETSFFRVLHYPEESPISDPNTEVLLISDYLPPPLSSALVLYNEFLPDDSTVFYEVEPMQYHWDNKWAGELNTRAFYSISETGIIIHGWNNWWFGDEVMIEELRYGDPLSLLPREFKIGDSQESVGIYADKYFDFENENTFDIQVTDKVRTDVVGFETVLLEDGEISAIRIDFTWDLELLDPATGMGLNEGELGQTIETWWLGEGRGLLKVGFESFSPDGSDSWSHHYIATRPDFESGQTTPDGGSGVGDPDLSPSAVEFTSLVVGKRLFEYGILPESRFSWEDEGGNWSYEKTSASAAELVFTYDDDGNESSVYREQIEMKFEDALSGSFIYSEWTVGERTSSLEGSFSLADLEAIPGFGSEQPNSGEDSIGVAPSKEAFNNLVVGRQFFDFAMISPTRFIWEGEGGDWTYEKTGPSTGRLVFTYDEDGNNRSIYFEQADFSFDDSVSGNFVYSEWSNQTKGDSLEGPFSLEDLREL